MIHMPSLGFLYIDNKYMGPPLTTNKCPAPKVSGAQVAKLRCIESRIVEKEKVTGFKKEKILELSIGFECLRGSERRLFLPKACV